jgi:subtilisin family serine protease
LYDIANFSSKGPLTDGTIKPDITAPGSLIYSAFNYFDTANAEPAKGITVDFMENDSDRDYPIIYAHGTSMSSPMVAGIVAFMLEKNSKLTQTEIKDILRTTAINDDWTGYNLYANKSTI